MQNVVFLNLPVKDLSAATAFYTALGLTKDESSSDEDTSMMTFSESLMILLMRADKFQSFVDKPIERSGSTCAFSVALPAATREAVDTQIERAIAAGATENKEPLEMGFMYNRSFFDLDGYLIEYVWLDPAAS